MEVSKNDWKLFRTRIGDWQEAYMGRLTKEYIDLLSGDENASDKFWELEERIKKDQIRNKWSKDDMKNAMHSSDSLQNVKRESKIIFDEY